MHMHVKEGKEVMRVLQKVEMHQVNREQNSMAHLLAQLARTVHTAVCFSQIPNLYCPSSRT
jgi:hypothetical protein